MLSRDDYLREWSRLHGGIDPRGNRMVLGWLSMVYAVGGRVARFPLSPNGITALGVLVAALAVVVVTAGGWWLLVAAVLVGAAGLLDSLDGAVAVLTGRVTRLGALLDKVADRVGDALFVAVLWVAGAPLWLCAAGLVAAYLVELVRVRARDVVMVTVFERPTRVIVTAMFLAATAVLGGTWATLGATAWLGLGAAGTSQLLIGSRHMRR